MGRTNEKESGREKGGGGAKVEVLEVKQQWCSWSLLSSTSAAWAHQRKESAQTTC